MVIPPVPTVPGPMCLTQRGAFMNNIIYIVGLIVVVLFILGLLGVY